MDGWRLGTVPQSSTGEKVLKKEEGRRDGEGKRTGEMYCGYSLN
jgi:hypothetical protein